MSGFLFDTHVWIWMQQGQVHELSEGFPAEAEQWQRLGRAFLSNISVWEVARLAADDHLELGMSVDQFVERGTEGGGLELVPLTPRILIESTRLPGDLHRDPADRILVATARELGLTLVTRDKLLLQYARKRYVSARVP